MRQSSKARRLSSNSYGDSPSLYGTYAMVAALIRWKNKTIKMINHDIPRRLKAVRITFKVFSQGWTQVVLTDTAYPQK